MQNHIYHDISNILTNHKLLEVFEEVSKEFTKIIEEDPSQLNLRKFSHEVLIGYQVYKSVTDTSFIHALEKNIHLYRFYDFLISFNYLLENVQESYKQEFLRYFKIKICPKEKFKPFHFEISVYGDLIRKGFKLIDIPEKNQKLKSTVDFLVKKDSQEFLVEGKTVMNYSGHPIMFKAADLFSKLIDSKTFENRPEELIEYTFDKNLTIKGGKEDEYTPAELAEKYHKDFREQNNNIKFFKIEEESSKSIYDKIMYLVTHDENKNRSQLLHFPSNKEKGTSHFLRLISEKPSKYNESIKKQIEKALKQGRPTDIPLMIYIQLECPPEILEEGKEKLKEIIGELIDEYDKPTIVNICTQGMPYLSKVYGEQGKLIVPCTKVQGYGRMLSINNSAFEVYKSFVNFKPHFF